MNLEGIALLCDFDGTISREDVGSRLFARFAGEASRRAVERWQRDEIGSRECLELECAAVSADRRALLDFVERESLDESFADLLALSRSVPFPLLVVSDGLDFYIRHLLERHGFGGVSLRTNQAVFGERGGERALGVRFPYRDRGCGECGNCKGQHVREFRREGRRVIYVGDGLSDRCGAREADLVFARRGRDLERWCREHGVAHLAFSSLGEVAALLAGEGLASLRERALLAVHNAARGTVSGGP